jgi:hypothetical protein
MTMAVSPSAGGGGMPAPPEVLTAIGRASQGGRPLTDGFRAAAEPAMGADFSRVRVHAGGDADALSRSLDAEAFTAGRHIFFRDGAYAPGTRAGRELLLHELTHAIQQSPRGEAGGHMALPRATSEQSPTPFSGIVPATGVTVIGSPMIQRKPLHYATDVDPSVPMSLDELAGSARVGVLAQRYNLNHREVWASLKRFEDRRGDEVFPSLEELYKAIEKQFTDEAEAPVAQFMANDNLATMVRLLALSHNVGEPDVQRLIDGFREQHGNERFASIDAVNQKLTQYVAAVLGGPIPPGITPELNVPPLGDLMKSEIANRVRTRLAGQLEPEQREVAVWNFFMSFFGRYGDWTKHATFDVMFDHMTSYYLELFGSFVGRGGFVPAPGVILGEPEGPTESTQATPGGINQPAVGEGPAPLVALVQPAEEADEAKSETSGAPKTQTEDIFEPRVAPVKSKKRSGAPATQMEDIFEPRVAPVKSKKRKRSRGGTRRGRTRPASGTGQEQPVVFVRTTEEAASVGGEGEKSRAGNVESLIADVNAWKQLLTGSSPGISTSVAAVPELVANTINWVAAGQQGFPLPQNWSGPASAGQSSTAGSAMSFGADAASIVFASIDIHGLRTKRKKAHAGEKDRIDKQIWNSSLDIAAEVIDMGSQATNFASACIDTSTTAGQILSYQLGAASGFLAVPVTGIVAAKAAHRARGAGKRLEGLKAIKQTAGLMGQGKYALQEQVEYTERQMKVRQLRNWLGFGGAIVGGAGSVLGALAAVGAALSIGALTAAVALTPVGWALAGFGTAVALGIGLYKAISYLMKKDLGILGKQREWNASDIIQALRSGPSDAKSNARRLLLEGLQFKQWQVNELAQGDEATAIDSVKKRLASF